VSEADWLNPSTGRRIKLFYFTKSEHVLDNLINRRIKVSTFKKCNDLFELAAVDLRFLKARKLHQDWSENLDKSTGLICCSVDWKNPLMWAHYGDNGSGACLVFDANWARAWPVKYTSVREMPASGFQFPNDPSDQEFRSLITTKFTGWSYEQEIRVAVSLEKECTKVPPDGTKARKDALYFFPFGSDLKFLGVINGPKSSLTETQIKLIDPNWHFLKSKLANQTFRMIPVVGPKVRAKPK
jgi:Protein of unknown function (DUF2971)